MILFKESDGKDSDDMDIDEYGQHSLEATKGEGGDLSLLTQSELATALYHQPLSHPVVNTDKGKKISTFGCREGESDYH